MALPPTYRARLSHKVILTPDTRDFFFELRSPDMATFESGQFMLIKATDPQTGEPISRAYSIACPPSENHVLRFCINIVPDGKLTPLIDSWQEGHEAEMQGPFGHFTLKSPEDHNLVFVGTGTGIAPLRSMIEGLLANGDQRKMSLFWGLRHEEDIFYKEDFEKIAASHPLFKFTLTLSRPQGAWEGPVGRVTAILPACEFDCKKTDVYICGGKTVIDDVKRVFVEKGVPENQIYFEQYFL